MLSDAHPSQGPVTRLLPGSSQVSWTSRLRPPGCLVVVLSAQGLLDLAHVQTRRSSCSEEAAPQAISAPAAVEDVRAPLGPNQVTIGRMLGNLALFLRRSVSLLQWVE